MRKKILCIATAFCMLFGMTPTVTFAAQQGAGQSGTSSTAVQKDIDQSTYDALGLKLDADEKADSMQAPYSTEHTSQLYTAREVYVAANGPVANRYVVRDGFDRMETDNRDSDIYGQNGDTDNLDGAYGFYGVSSSNISAKNGNTLDSKLSSNFGNVLKKADNGFNGIYATSTAFNSGDDKDNYVAELRAYGKATDRYGALRLCLFKIEDNGNRVEKSKLDIKNIDDSTMKFGDSSSYLTRRYIQEMDAIMDVASADVDGDGYDEIFAYSGQWKDQDGIRYAYVDMYSGKNGSYSLVKRIPVNAGRANSYTMQEGWEHYIKRTPVVTLAGGDLDRDGDDEVAITVSASTDNRNVAGVGRLIVYDWNKTSKSLETVNGLSDISLAAGDGKAMVSANCAFGTFSLPDTSITGTVLLVAGYQSNNTTSNADSGTYTMAGYRYVYYDPSSKRYRVSAYDTLSLGNNGYRIADSYVNDPSNGYYRPTHAPIALGCADLEGAGADNNDNEVLLGGEVYEFNTDMGFIKELMSVSVCANQVNDRNNNKDKEQLWISDVTAGTVDTDPAGNSSFHGKSAHKWRESFVYTLGAHRAESVNGDDDYYWMDLGAAYLDGSKYYSTQEGVIAESNHRGDDYGTFLSLALPDIGNDSVKMRYVDQHTVYTDPEVYAVLQASPYFSDLAEVYDYIGNGGTAYGVSKSTGTTEGMSLSQSVGVYHSSEVQLFGGGEYEIEFSTTYSYDYAVSTEVEHSITYNNQAGGGDQVVLYTIPYVYYLYDMYDPIAKKWTPTVMPAAMDPVTTVLNVEAYDEIAESTEGLEPIAGNLLYSTPGEPETYVNQPAGDRVHTYNGAYSNQSSAGSGSDITQEISVTKGTEHTVDISMELNYKVGGGAALLGNNTYVGVTGSTGAGASFTHSSSEGTTFSGTVDGLPEEATQYGFSWKLIVNSAELNGKPVWIVGYDVKDVHQPPRMPQDLTITEVGTDYIDLAWENSGNAASYELSLVTSTGNYNKIATLPYTVTEYKVEGLRSNTQYSFSIRAVSATKGASINSPVVTAATMNSGANFVVTVNPEDQTTAAGKQAPAFNAGAVYTCADGKIKPVGYEWQYSAPDMKNKWKALSDSDTVSGAATPSLTITPSEDMDGFRYRCRMYYMEYTLYTSPAVLTVDKSESTVSLGGQVKEGDVLSASGKIVEPDTDATENVNGKEYTLTAVPRGLDGAVLDGDVSFMISGPVSETVKAVKGIGGVYTAVWTPKGEGRFTITAVFAGNELYYASESAPITAYAVMNKEGRSVVSLSAPANITYGSSAALAVTKLTNGIGAVDATGSSSYTVEKLDVSNNKYIAAGSSEYELSDDGSRFTPKLVGSFRITANNDGVQASAVIAVGKGSAVLAAADTARSLNDSNRAPDAAVLSGTASWDDISLEAGVDYTLTTEGAEAQETGEYPIIISFRNTSTDGNSVKYTDKVRALLEKYNVSLKNAVYTLNSENYRVTASAGSNGSVSITSKSPGSDSYIPVQSGILLPAGSGVTVTAAADSGYVVSRWKVNGNYIVGSDGGSFYNGGVYTIETLDGNADISVEFEPGKNTLTYSAADVHGTVAGNYITNTGTGDRFTSASNVNYNQKIRLTAAPADGYVVDLWTVQRGSGAEETVKAADGLGNYTSLTYDISHINENVIVKVYFVKDELPVITIRPVDDNGAALASVKVSVNGQTATSDSSGSFIYNGHTGDDLTITVAPPDGVLVNEWTDKDGNTVGDLSDNNRTLTIYDLRESKEFTVKCSALNSYTVSFGGEMKDGSDFAASGNSVSAARIGSGAVTSGTLQSQGSTVQFEAAAADGYEIAGWTLNGRPVTGSGSISRQTYQIPSLSEPVNVVVIFIKKPRIIFEAGANGTLACGDMTSGAFVDYSDPGPLSFTATPDKGYVIDDWTVNGRTVTADEVADSDAQVFTYEPDEVSGITSDITVNVTFKALDTVTVEYTVVDINGDEEGGLNGALKAAASRGTVDSYNDSDNDGVTSGSKLVYEGGKLTITALADEGYRVKEWNINGSLVEKYGAVYTGTQLENAYADISDGDIITVMFEKGDARISFSDPANGKLTAEAGGAPFTSGGSSKAEVVFTVVPDTNYEVKSWKVNGEVQTGETAETFTYSPNGTNVIVAVELQGIVLDISAEAGDGGTVTASLPETVRYGDTVILKAEPEPGFKFEGWYLNGTRIDGAGASYTFHASESGVYQARFVHAAGMKVEFSVDDESHGNISATADGVDMRSGDVADGSSKLVFTVIPDNGYRVYEWTGLPENAVIGADKNTVTVNGFSEDLSIQAKLETFETHTVTVSDAEHGKIIVTAYGKDITSDTSAVPDGTELTFTAVPDPNWMLDRWTDDASGRTGNSFTVAVTEDMTVGAAFKDAVNYTVKYGMTGENGAVSATADDKTLIVDMEAQIPGGSRIVFTAEPDSGYMVKEWTVNGRAHKELSDRLVIDSLGENTDVKVSFEEISLHEIPADTTEYTIENIVKNPADLGSERQIRDRGSVVFTVRPTENKVIKALKVNGCDEKDLSISYNTDGSCVVTANNIHSDIKLEAEITENTGGNGSGGGGSSGGSGGSGSSGSGGSSSGGNTSNGNASNGNNSGENNGASGSEADITGVSKLLETDKHIAYLSGYSNGLFGPKDNMTRAQAAQMFYNLLKDKNVESTVTFTDVSDGAWYAKAVNTLSSLGIMNGTGNGGFAPERNITRAEFIVTAMRFAKQNTEGKASFSDVSENDWFYTQVIGASGYGWIDGYSDGTFRPNAMITRAEVTAVVNRMLSRNADTAWIDSHASEIRAFTDVPASYWAYYTIAEAVNLHDHKVIDGAEQWSL